MRQAAEIALYVIGFVGTVALFLGLFIVVADPYGLDTFGLSIFDKNVPRAGRAERDRIVRPLDIRAQHPRTIFLGTSRVKQAIDPSLLSGTTFAPAYNAGVDRASLGEMRALLQDAIREDRDLRVAFIELMPSQFYVGRHLGEDVRSLMLTRPWPLSADAIAMARDTVGAALLGWPIKYAIRPDGMQSDPPVHAQPRTWMKAFSKYWKTRDPTLKEEIYPPAFAQLDAIRNICDKANIRCVFYVGPLSPPVMAALYFDGALDTLFDWKRRIAAFGGVIDFSRPIAPFWEIHWDPKPLAYWADTSHFSIEGGEVIVSALRRHVEGLEVEPGIVLTNEEVERQKREWPVAISVWLSENPTVAADFQAGSE